MEQTADTSYRVGGLKNSESRRASGDYSKARRFLFQSMSIEAYGLYRSVNIAAQFDRDLASFLLGRLAGISSADHSFWEVSALAKYHVPLPFVKPYISAGPSFRTVDGLNDYFSTTGVTGALGAEFETLKLRAGPEFPYTHWGNDPATAPAFAGNWPAYKSQSS